METLERREVLTALYWDTNGATPGLGGSGDWDEVATNWTTDSAGASATQAWNSAAGDTAIFGGTPGAVTLGAGISAAGLSFTANGYSLGSNALTLTGGAQVSMATGIAATLASEIAGSAGLVKTGAGTLSLTNANTYGGVTTVSGGVLDIQHGSALGSTANGTVVANNAALQLQGGITIAGETLTIGGNGIANTGALRNVSGDNTFTGAITTNTGVVSRIHSDSGSLNLSGGVHSPGGNSLYLSGAGNGVESGVISNLYQLVKEGTGTWTLSGENTYTTTTNIVGGTLQVGNGGGTGKLGSGNVVNNAQLVFNRTGAYTVANVISGTGSLTKNGSGVMTLSGNNTYGGVTTVNAGVLLVNHNSALGSNAAGTNVISGARVVLANGRNVASESITIAGNGGDYNGALQADAAATATWGGTVTLNSADARLGAGINGVLIVSGGVLGNGAFQNLLIGAGVGGSGVVMLSAPSGSSTYTGSTGIVRGTLMMGAVNTLPAGTVLNVDTANAAEAATFDLNNFAQSIGGIIRTNTGGGAGAARVINSGGAAHTLTVNQTGETEFSGETKGKLNLTLIGDGTLTFSGAHNASGVTTVSNGELHITETGSVGGTVNTTGSGTLTGPAAWYEITLSGMTEGETGGSSEGTLTLGTSGTLVVSALDWLRNWHDIIRDNVEGSAHTASWSRYGDFPSSYFKVNTVAGFETAEEDGEIGNFEISLPDAEKIIAWEDWTDNDWDDYYWIATATATHAPTITSNGGGSSATIDVVENQTAVTDVQSTDLDGTVEGSNGLTYTISGGADRTKFNIVANSGVLTFKAAPNFEVPTDVGVNNVYDVQVTVTDPTGLTDVQTIAVTITNANEAPKFIDETVVDASYGTAEVPKPVGRELEVGDVVFATTVLHEDAGQTLSYEIGTVTSNGVINSEGLFAINSSGEIVLAKPVSQAAFSRYAMYITVRDSESPQQTDQTVLFLEFKKSVGVKGDTQGVEGGQDNIKLAFERFGMADFSNEPALTVYYEVWLVDPAISGYASASDFEAGDFSALQTPSPAIPDRVQNGWTVKTRTATIPAGQKESAQIELRVAADSNAERLEIGLVVVVAPPSPAAGQDYTPVATLADTKKSNLDAYGSVLLQLLDGVVLFAPHNDTQGLHDDNLEAGNPGIHVNDVAQGSLGDCYLMAAVGAMIEHANDWQSIYNLFTPTYDANGCLVSTVVRLFDQPVVNAGADNSLTIGNISESPGIGDTISIEGIAGAFTVAAVTSFDAGTKTASVTLNNPLVAAPAVGKAVTITHANGDAIGWRDITVNAQLSEGPDQARLSGDRVAANDYKYEVWTIMLEKAYAAMKGGYNNIVSGNSGDAWTALNGPGTPAVWHPISEYSSGNTLMQAIETILENGGQVVVSIKDHPDPANPTAKFVIFPNQIVAGGATVGGKVYGDHAYIAREDHFLSSPTGGLVAIQLYNPHGATEPHPWVLASDLEQIVEGIYELR